jgi:hypothetical protein
MPETLLTPAQLAERWQKPESTLAQWRWRGVGPTYLKLQGAVRYRLSDVEAYEASSIQPQPAA